MNSSLRTGDTVLVIAGKDKGKTGKIIASYPETGKVTIDGINIVSKHRKPRSQKDKGGIKKEAAPIDVSNVQLVCPHCSKATRVSHGFDDKGDKHRKCKKCGAFMDPDKKSRVKVKKEKAKEKEPEPVAKKEEKKAKAVAPKALTKSAKTTAKTTKTPAARRTPANKSLSKSK